jgi:hypothetical protein
MRLVLSVLAAVALTATAAAHTIVPAAFRELVSGAGLIVRGAVTDVRAITAADGSIESVATVAIESTLKGQSGGAFVSVHLPGGEMGRRRVVMIGAPRVRQGDGGVWFLTRRTDGAWQPLGLSQGIFRVGPDASGAPVVLEPPVLAGPAGADGPIVRGSPERRPLRVPEFEALVRLIAAGSARPLPRVRLRP